MRSNVKTSPQRYLTVFFPLLTANVSSFYPYQIFLEKEKDIKRFGILSKKIGLYFFF